MTKVGEVAGVGDDDLMAAGRDGRDEVLRGGDGFSGELCLEGSDSLLTVETQAVQDICQALALHTLRR
jgi:hypothetical protein